ncbi:MAG: tyrosine-type recombinase/integrase [Gammaproteobacteria bacterium]|nr:tyrosine-type recombinase/integrase [Gammaproteobacteria bacterium]
MPQFTDAKARKLTTPGLHTVDTTLYLRITDRSKYWVQRITIKGKRRDLGLGAFPVVSVDEAREAAFRNRRLVRAGGDPFVEKRKALKPDFEAAAMATLDTLRPTWRNGRTEQDWRRCMDTYVFPRIGHKRIDLIGRADILDILVPMWTEKNPTAQRVRGWIRAVFSWAQAFGHIEVNPAADAISAALPRGAGNTKHHRALHHAEVRDALEQTDHAPACDAAKLCLRFIALTAVRSNEARAALWSEIDLNNKTWTVPAARMKSNRAHRVPLSGQAITVLDKTGVLRDTSGLVFPSPMKPGKPLSNAVMMLLLQKAGLADRATVHGLRSSFRDWCAESGKDRQLAEMALAHVVPGVEGSYFRSDLFARRERLMQQWADYITGASTARVVMLNSGRHP